jgi:hypothetical protein
MITLNQDRFLTINPIPERLFEEVMNLRQMVSMKRRIGDGSHIFHWWLSFRTKLGVNEYAMDLRKDLNGLGEKIMFTYISHYIHPWRSCFPINGDETWRNEASKPTQARKEGMAKGSCFDTVQGVKHFFAGRQILRRNGYWSQNFVWNFDCRLANICFSSLLYDSKTRV